MILLRRQILMMNSGSCSLGAYRLEQIPSQANGWLFRKGHPFLDKLNEAVILNQVSYVHCTYTHAFDTIIMQ